MNNVAERNNETMTFEKAASDFSLKSGKNYPPFLPLYEKVGHWVTGEILDSREMTYKPKKGKQKGKSVTKSVWTIEIENSNIDGAGRGARFTISAAGLLAYQLENLPENVSIPFKVGIKYMGKDDEGRHQTEVRFA